MVFAQQTSTNSPKWKEGTRGTIGRTSTVGSLGAIGAIGAFGSQGNHMNSAGQRNDMSSYLESKR